MDNSSSSGGSSSSASSSESSSSGSSAGGSGGRSSEPIVGGGGRHGQQQHGAMDQEQAADLHRRAGSGTSTDSWLEGSGPTVPAASSAHAPAATSAVAGGGHQRQHPHAHAPARPNDAQSQNPAYTPEVPFNFCVECEDQSAEVTCIDCGEDFCRPCFASQHRRGKRAEHRVQALLGEMMAAPEVPESTEGVGMMIVQQAQGGGTGEEEEDEEGRAGAALAANAMHVDDDLLLAAGTGATTTASASATSATSGAAPEHPPDPEYDSLRERAAEHFDDGYVRIFMERCRSIPMRLTARERKLLAVLESALNVSEYTDNVDTVSRKPKANRIIEELEHLFATILGLMICSEPAKGVELVRRDVAENGAFFREIFEVGRRYKIMNPDKMRGSYGKLMYMLQDTQARAIQPQIGFACVKEVVTVVSFLEERGALPLLQDARVLIATRDITDHGGRKSREAVDAEVSHKRRAAAELKAAFASPDLSAEDIQRVLDSVADANNYLNFNAGPVRRMIRHLLDNFDPEEVEAGFSLAIGGGGGGRYAYKPRMSVSSYMYGGGYGSSYFRTDSAKLSHDHATHFTYVWQSLKLWREIMRNMYRVWLRADQDLLSPQAPYQLLNTGQGLNRVQLCPKVGSEMRAILSSVQRECGSWVGLSVVHLGDRDVPNALMFIDKYTQVPRILAPVARVIEQLAGLFEGGNGGDRSKLSQQQQQPKGSKKATRRGAAAAAADMELEADDVAATAAAEAEARAHDALRRYAEDVWESAENLKMHVLVDFFKHAFDGDGDDGGSCIDGRLTSAWNWCSKLTPEKKPYYYAFMLCGFQGFDGDFRGD